MRKTMNMGRSGVSRVVVVVGMEVVVWAVAVVGVVVGVVVGLVV